MNLLREYILQLHDEAVRDGKEYYIDPSTGHNVATERYLRDRGWCCKLFCRHCPYATVENGGRMRDEKEES